MTIEPRRAFRHGRVEPRRSRRSRLSFRGPHRHDRRRPGSQRGDRPAVQWPGDGAAALYERAQTAQSAVRAGAGNGVYLRQVIENALEQTERVSAMLKQISDLYPNAVPAGDVRSPGDDKPAAARSPDVMFAPEAGRKPLTKREREVLSLISDGYSNKQGALRMNISPRTFESHRAEAMRKLGARNTADLVRKALLHSA